MTPRITTLTPQQAALLPAIRDKWLAIGLSTGAPDKAAAEAALADVYRAGGLEPPRFVIWLDSPWAGVVGRCHAPEIVADGLRRLGSRGQVYGQVRGPVDGPVDGQVGGQVRDPVYGPVYGPVDGQVGDQVYGQVRDQVYGQVRDQVYGPVGGQVYGQVGGQVYGQVGGQVYGPVYGQVGDPVYGPVDGQVGGQVDDQVDDQVYGPVDDQVRDQVYGQVRDPVDGPVGDQVDSSAIRARLTGWWQGLLWGQWNAGYYGWLDAHEQIGVTGLAPIHAQQQLAQAGVGYYWVYRDFAILTPRSLTLHRDQQGRLHAEDVPAMVWADGWAIHAWHGTRVPADLIETGWDTDRILREENTEVRRCAIERMGWDRFIAAAGLKQVGATEPDPGNPGQEIALYAVPRKIYGTEIRVLLCTNGTIERDGTRRRFGLTVPARVKDPIEAAAWGYGLTRGEYLTCQRRA